MPTRTYRALLCLAAVTSLIALAGAQSPQDPASTDMPVATQFNSLHFRSIGPASMSGRITDFTAFEANPAIFYVASAHGGLWKTTDGGGTFTPEFQQDGLMSVGSVQVSQHNPDLVWLGSGEGNNRQSISWGDGIWKSTDGGKTWKNMGLAHSFHINRIVIDPDDDNTVLVAAQGSLFGPGGDRGIYKTTDGGATWKQVLKGDENTGANDLVMAATDHKILYASSFERQRSQCCMNGGGPGSAIWKSTDGGDTWKKLSGGGLPSGSLGRIALAVYRHSENIVYAEIEGDDPVGGRGGAGGGAGAGRGAGASASATGVYRTDDGGMSWRKTADPDNRPIYFSQVRIDPNNPDHVLVASVRLYLSLDGARSFTPIDTSEHDDKHAIWWDPRNSNHLLIGTDGGAYTTWDMGHTWIWYPNLPVGLFYHVGYDNNWPYNVCGGMQDNYDWCGPSAVRTAGGITNDRWQTIQGGDGFVAIMDPKDDRTVYSETQDGATMRHDRITGESKSIRPGPQNVANAAAGEVGCDKPTAGAEGGRGGNAGPCAAYRFNWDTPMTFSPNDAGVLYIAGNHVFRSTDRGDSWTAVSPDLTTDANRDQIATMGVMGSEVHIAKNDGISAWPTIVSFAESPKQAGLYYAGTDDGTVSVSRDGGKTWDKTLAARMPGFVPGGWVSKVMPSRYDAGTVYIASDAHRLNDYETHLWVSHDFGASFQSLNGNLHGQAIKTLTEDPRNPDVLYAGAETGLFVSLDRGQSWQRIEANLPTVRVDEITIQPRDNAMLLATHGRAIWILDHLAPIQEYAAAQSAAAAHLFTPDPALEWKSWQDKNEEFWAQQYFMGENPPKQAVIQYELKSAADSGQLKISDASGAVLRTVALTGARLHAGIETACWDFHVEPLPAPAGGAAAGRGGRGGAGGPGGRGPAWADPQPSPGYGAVDPCAGEGGGGGGRGGFGGGGNEGPMVPAGNYSVALVVNGQTIESKPLQVVMDPAVSSRMSVADYQRYYDLAMSLHELQRNAEAAAAAMEPFYKQMQDAAGKVSGSNAPDTVKAQFATLQQQFNAVRVKFGVPAPAAPAGGRGFGGGGRGGAPVDPNNLVARVGQVKGQILAFTETPSSTLQTEADAVRAAYPKAVAELNAVYAQAARLGPQLQSAQVALNAPATVVWMAKPATAATNRAAKKPKG